MHSYYLVLLWNKAGWYQLYQYPRDVVTPDKVVRWSFPNRLLKAEETAGRRLTGFDDTGTLVEWYGESGGQLKYYPLAANAIWTSEPFRHEPLSLDKEHGILIKVADYFPQRWAEANRPDVEQ